MSTDIDPAPTTSPRTLPRARPMPLPDIRSDARPDVRPLSRLRALARLAVCAAASAATAAAASPNTTSAVPATAAVAAESGVTDASPAAPPTAPPWSERALGEHVELGERHRSDGPLDPDALAALLASGEHLFTARFTTEDGAGRPLATQAILPTKRRRAARTEFSRTAGLDANACASCHHAPAVGGAGDFSANVFVSEGFNQSDFDTTDPQFSNERNTNHLFGAGLIELLAREMSVELQGQRRAALRASRRTGEPVEAALSAKGVSFGHVLAHPDGRLDTRGVDGVDIDLVVRPFGHKGVMTSLRQFTVNALNHHHGMQASERFGARWTGERDHDGDAHEREITEGDVSALVAWQASLPPPAVDTALGRDWLAAAERGGRRFESLGCTACHRPSLPLETLVFEDPGPFDAAGTLRPGEGTDLSYDLATDARIAALPRDERGRVLVPLFGDLKRHAIADAQVAALGNERLSQRFVERDVFMTTELWGVGSTAPYGHRGDMTTLAEVIAAHGGKGRASRDAWLALGTPERGEVIAFLRTLVIAP